MAAISQLQRIAGPRHAGAPRPGTGRRASVAVAAGKAPLRGLEGASEELRAAAAQSLDWAPARRRVRGVFAPVLPTLDHCLFKVRSLFFPPFASLGAAGLDPFTSSPCRASV
jgi:acylglycerol lipase